MNKLSDKFALLYTWMIPFQDDFGLIRLSINKIKWTIAPARKNLSKKDIEGFIDKIIELKLVKIVVIEDKPWIWFPDFTEKQTLKKDRPPSTYLDDGYNWDFVDKIAEFVVKDDKWKSMETNGFQMELDVPQVELQSKLTKAKLTSVPNFFDKFWEKYPRKVCKSSSLKAFNRLHVDSSLLQSILKDVQRKRESKQWQDNDGQFIPYPSTYLNKRRWEDEDNKKNNFLYK